MVITGPQSTFPVAWLSRVEREAIRNIYKHREKGQGVVHKQQSSIEPLCLPPLTSW